MKLKIKPVLMIECLFVLAALSVFPVSAFHTPVPYDEHDWIYNSSALDLFIRGDFSNPYWDLTHDNLTQPPMARYIVGIGRILGGYDVASIQHTRDFYKVPSYVVDWRLIYWSRSPMIILAILLALMLYWLLRRDFGWIAAVTFLGLFTMNRSMVSWLVVAQSDMPVLFFAALAIPFALLALYSWQTAQVETGVNAFFHSLFWLALVGVMGGLSAAAKLNGFATALAGSTLGMLLPFFDHRQIPGRVRLSVAIRGATFPVLAGLLTMILINPFFYKDPLARIGKMLAYRSYEMNWQAEMFTNSRVPGGWEHLPFMIQRVFDQYASLHIPLALWVNILFCVIGLVVLGRSAYRWFACQEGSPSGIVLLMVGAWLVLPMMTTLVDWARYYMFPVLFSTLAIAIGFQRAVTWGHEEWAKAK